MMSRSKKPTILIVDDTPNNIRVLAESLSQDYFIKVAKSGIAALDIIQQDKPVLVLLDVMMPGMDGYEVCRRIKSDPYTKDIPVIFVTAKNDAQDEEKGLNLGAIDYITKPYQLPIVKTRVRSHVNLKLRSDQLEALVHIDSLTNIPNRRCFDETLNRELKAAIRNGTPLSLVLIDIDYFKKYNDNYGHGQGDICLKQVANAIAESATRPCDLVARYGGEEFVAILPQVDWQGARNIAEKMRSNVAALNINHQFSKTAEHVTISLGMICKVPTIQDSAEQLLKQADDLLYKAKHNGRNQVCYQE